MTYSISIVITHFKQQHIFITRVNSQIVFADSLVLIIVPHFIEEINQLYANINYFARKLYLEPGMCERWKNPFKFLYG